MSSVDSLNQEQEFEIVPVINWSEVARQLKVPTLSSGLQQTMGISDEQLKYLRAQWKQGGTLLGSDPAHINELQATMDMGGLEKLNPGLCVPNLIIDQIEESSLPLDEIIEKMRKLNLVTDAEFSGVLNRHMPDGVLIMEETLSTNNIITFLSIIGSQVCESLGRKLITMYTSPVVKQEYPTHAHTLANAGQKLLSLGRLSQDKIVPKSVERSVTLDITLLLGHDLKRVLLPENIDGWKDQIFWSLDFVNGDPEKLGELLRVVIDLSERYL